MQTHAKLLILTINYYLTSCIPKKCMSDTHNRYSVVWRFLLCSTLFFLACQSPMPASPQGSGYMVKQRRTSQKYNRHRIERIVQNALRSGRILLNESRGVIRTRWPLVECITTSPSQGRNSTLASCSRWWATQNSMVKDLRQSTSFLIHHLKISTYDLDSSRSRARKSSYM